MDYQKLMVRRTLEGAGENTGIQLQFLLQRLESYPDAWGAIIESIEDMATWAQAQADALDAEAHRRNGGAEVVKLDPEGGAA
ncbi:MAG: hypothetical protein JJU19_03990 [Pararhodobacter sp.]|nr:hypothetical protein [Pararhodobacter sp.]